MLWKYKGGVVGMLCGGTDVSVSNTVTYNMV